jgi:hypothetical protein
MDILKCIFRYNTSIMDYFIFKFYELNEKERNKWAGTGYMFEYQSIMNPKESRHILANKIEFYYNYPQFISHSMCTLIDLKENNIKAKIVLENPKGKIVVKNSLGQCGWNIEILKTIEYPRISLIEYMIIKGFDLAEEFIEQHPTLASLSPSGLNTIRIITQINKRNEIEIIGARLRISINSIVDNLASGNIAVPIDVKTGKVCGIGIYSDITKPDVEKHPITGVPFLGFEIPFWNQTVDLAIRGAKIHPENRSIGWDIAITSIGPEFIEGNHNWCKNLWQLPEKKGMKAILDSYL